MRRKWLLILLIAFEALVPGSAWAAPRDATARKRIEEAIEKYYLATDFARAEAVITAEITACGNRCSPALIAKAWMYVGIVRGSGKNDQAAAREAFASALVFDPNVTLDEGLATPETTKTFAAAKRKKGKTTAQPTPTPGETDDTAGKMECSGVGEVQTRRPIPIACTTAEEATKSVLHYKLEGEKWKRIEMKQRRGAFLATIPCTATRREGGLRFYVRAQDSAGDDVDSFGKKREPVQIEVVRETEEESPSFPDEEPPARCSKSASTGSVECSSSEDCPKGAKCIEGTCAGGKRDDGGGGPITENWLGLHVAYDFAIVGGSDVCSQASQRDNGFACFYEGSEDQYQFDAQPSVSNEIKTGLAPATYRAMLSFDRVVGDNVSAGVRLGYAFGGGPPSGEDKDSKFLPYHAELRVSYWFGDRPFAQEGIRPYVGASAGAAQVDAKLPVKVGDCGGQPDGSAPSKAGATLPIDQAFSVACANDQLASGQGAAPLALDAYKKFGKAFAGIHAGAMYAVSRDSGIQLNVSFMYFLPTTGSVIEPSIGYVFGL